MDGSLIARRKSKLWVCISSFHEQFDDWKELTNTPKWSTHFTQVRAVEKLLVGVSDRIKEAADKLGISVAEFVRRAIRRELPVPVEGQKPWMRYAGFVESGDPRSSDRVDEVIYGAKD